MALKPPVTQQPSGASAPATGQGLKPQQAPIAPSAPGGYIAQGPPGPIQATPSTIGGQTPQPGGATRSGAFTAPRMAGMPQPLLQGIDTTLGAGRPTGTYSHLFANNSYADGGPVTNNTIPSPQQAMPQQEQQGQQADPRMISMEMQRVARENPETAQRIAQAAPQMGITPDNAEQVGQVAMLGLQRPDLYPQLRQFAIRTFGIPESEFPPQHSQRFLAGLLFAASVMGGGNVAAPPPPDANAQQDQMAQQQAAMQQEPQPQQAQQGMATGGKVEGPGTETSDSIPANLSDGEFVVPADVVKAKGTEFFNKLVAQYHTPAAQQE